MMLSCSCSLEAVNRAGLSRCHLPCGCKGGRRGWSCGVCAAQNPNPIFALTARLCLSDGGCRMARCCFCLSGCFNNRVGAEVALTMWQRSREGSGSFVPFLTGTRAAVGCCWAGGNEAKPHKGAAGWELEMGEKRSLGDPLLSHKRQAGRSHFFICQVPKQ